MGNCRKSLSFWTSWGPTMIFSEKIPLSKSFATNMTLIRYMSNHIFCSQDIQLELLMEMYYQVIIAQSQNSIHPNFKTFKDQFLVWKHYKDKMLCFAFQARFTGSATARLFIYVTAYQFWNEIFIDDQFWNIWLMFLLIASYYVTACLTLSFTSKFQKRPSTQISKLWWRAVISSSPFADSEPAGIDSVCPLGQKASRLEIPHPLGITNITYGQWQCMIQEDNLLAPKELL